MHKVAIGLIGLAVLCYAGLVSTGAKAAPPVPTLKQQSLVEEVRWRRVRVRRPIVRRTVRRPVRRTLRRATRPWRWRW